MVNMMMQTQAVSSSSPSQDVPAALTSQLGAKSDLAQHTQQLGELKSLPYVFCILQVHCGELLRTAATLQE